MSPGLDGTSCFSGHDDGQVFVVVAVAITDAGAERNHAVIEEAAVSFRNGLQSL